MASIGADGVASPVSFFGLGFRDSRGKVQFPRTVARMPAGIIT